VTVAAEDTPDAVFAALRENNDRPYGRARTVRAEELVAAAEQFDDKGALVTALFELMSAYTYGGEQRKSPVAFARIMKMWDERPEDFSEWEEHQLYWRFKWVTTALLQLPEMPLAAIERWTGEMRERYAAAGHGMQPVYAMRYLVARHTGTATDEAYDLWTTRPRTDLSDCEACETRLRARHHEASGDDERALREWRPVLEGGQSCLEEPYVSMAYALLPLVRTGRTDEARSHHLAGYRFARGKPDMAEAIGLHLEFCALTRNEGRGLEILAENRAMFEATGTPLDLLGFLTGVEVLLARLAGQGHGTLAVSGPPGRSWTVDALLAHVRAEGARLAAAFDARNGSDAVGARRLARLARTPLLDTPLALGVRAAGPALPAPAPAPGPVGAAAEPAPEDFGDLVRRARELSAIGRPDADGLWDLVERRAAEPGHVHDEALGPAELLAAELAERRAFAGFDRDDWGPARDTMLEAAARYDAAGNPGRAASARARAATALVAAAQQTDGAAHRADAGDGEPDTGRTAEARAELAAELLLAQRLSETGAIEPDRYLAILQCAAMVARHDLVDLLPEPPGEAVDAFETAVARLLAEAERLGSPSRASAARQYAAEVAARTGEFEAATAELDRALQLVEDAGQPWRTPRPLALLAQIKVQSGHAEEAVPLVHRALAAAARWPDASLSLGPFHALLGHACAHSGDLTGAVRHLSEAADRLDREDAPAHAAQVRLELADVLAEDGRAADAVAVLESVVLGGTAELDPRLAAQIRLNLARGLASLGEQRAAAEEFLRLADEVAQWTDEQYTHTLVACEAAAALAKAGLWDAARTAYDRAVAGHAKAPRPAPVLGMMREFARQTMAAQEADGLADALGYLAHADEVIAAAADSPDVVVWYQRGATRYQRSRCHASAHAYQEALAEMERAISAYEDGGPAGEEPRAEAVRIAALLEANALGAPDAARARLTAAVARCEAAGLPQAAAALAATRESLAAR
jgi:tetratricopeptide (TPR) repeat protein